MRALAIALSLLFLVTTAAAAQQPAPAPQQPAAPSEGVNTGKVVAIGIGALLGIVAGEALMVGDAVTLVGGVAGGAIGAWWYNSSNETASPRTNVKPTAAHEAAYHGGPLLIIR